MSWYHVTYLWGLRRAREDEPVENTRWEDWGSLLFRIIPFVTKIMWAFVKYAAAPLIPLAIADGLRGTTAAGFPPPPPSTTTRSTRPGTAMR